MASPHEHAPLTVFEALGLDPLPLRLREAWLALRGDKSIPATRFGLSSLRIFHPALSVATWLGHKRADRLIPLSNLFNHTPTPLEDGWSVRKTQVRDFRGGALTYDSHNGTDLAIPVGTVVTAAAPGVVLRISSEYNRGGLKVFIDHGRGLVSTSNHLARALVRIGDVVERGEPVALSGYSGLDALVSFPWSVPHVHFNVWLNGEYVDPFAAPGETALWQDGNSPQPAQRAAARGTTTRAALHEGSLADCTDDALDAAIAACRDAQLRETLRSEPDRARRAMDVLFHRNYYPTRFDAAPPLYGEDRARAPHLSLPFRAEDFDGITFADGQRPT